MSEEIQEYNGKTITYTGLAEYVDSYALQKIFENGHKDDPLKRDYLNLMIRLGQERSELSIAILRFMSDETEDNAVEAIKEIGDCVNILRFIAGKLAGYTALERR